ncbi:hypothetical protein C0992_007655 [Termitomyces sp. T32_za158]|nr:hypothetical protein C0992_007655 [Termitomyces sp. T32_za158]
MIHADWEKHLDSFSEHPSATTSFPASATTSVPPSPAAPAPPSPPRDRSSSLSPAPETGSLADSPRKDDDDDDPARVGGPSRLSTPLSDLSPPPPDHDEDPEPPPRQQPPRQDAREHTKLESTPGIASPLAPWSVSSFSSDPKVVSILDLNVELLKVCMEFPNRGISHSEPLFSQ